jgi:hypothetical protein
MHDDELHRFKSDIHLAEYAAERYGYQRDRRESSARSHVLRHTSSGDKIVVRQDDDGHWTYFSVRDDRDHGTIVDFVRQRGRHPSLGSVRQELRQWLGTARPVPEYAAPPVRRDPGISPADAFLAARVADTCAYLAGRGLRSETLRDPRFAGTWRLDARGNVLFVHRGEDDVITGFEIKNRGFTGFAPGGTKSAWRSAVRDGDRALVVTESAIDALSHHQLHPEARSTTRYLSTAGQPSPSQMDLLDRVFARLPFDTTVVAAVDSDAAGRDLANRIRALVHGHARLAFRRDAPERAKDWNEVLQRVERDAVRARGPGRLTHGPPERER